MLSPRLTNCPECANIPSLLRKIDCKLAELGNNLYNNISYILNKPVPAGDITQLIGYRRILMYKLCNPNYVHKYSVAMISSKVIRLTVGCVSKCNTPEPCIEASCDITVIPNTTSTSSTSTTTSTSTSTSTSSTTTTTTTIACLCYTVTATEFCSAAWINCDGTPDSYNDFGKEPTITICAQENSLEITGLAPLCTGDTVINGPCSELVNCETTTTTTTTI